MVRKESETLRYLRKRYIGDDPAAIAEYEQIGADMEVAQAVYDLRIAARLSHRQLAAKIRSTASAIRQLEEADYEGHSLAMLKRIAAALGKRVEIRCVPASKPRRKSRKAA